VPIGTLRRGHTKIDIYGCFMLRVDSRKRDDLQHQKLLDVYRTIRRDRALFDVDRDHVCSLTIHGENYRNLTGAGQTTRYDQIRLIESLIPLRADVDHLRGDAADRRVDIRSAAKMLQSRAVQDDKECVCRPTQVHRDRDAGTWRARYVGDVAAAHQATSFG